MNQRHHGFVSGGSAQVRLAIGVFCAALHGTDSPLGSSARAEGDTLPALALRTAGAAEACKPAAVYFHTGISLDNGGQGPVTIEVSASAGAQEFTFASGSTQANIVSALEAFALSLGIEVAAASPERVGIFAAANGPAGFVRVRQPAGGAPRIHAEPAGGVPSDDLTDVGSSVLSGDTNCDAVIDALDVMDLLARWGACADEDLACAGDLDGNRVVDADDLSTLLAGWTP